MINKDFNTKSEHRAKLDSKINQINRGRYAPAKWEQERGLLELSCEVM